MRRITREPSVRKHHHLAYARIRQHPSAYVSIRKYQGPQACRKQHARRTSRQHTSAYVSIRQHTSAYEPQACRKRRSARHARQTSRAPYGTPATLLRLQVVGGLLNLVGSLTRSTHERLPRCCVYMYLLSGIEVYLFGMTPSATSV